MIMKKWIEIIELGELYYEIVLVHFDVPLLFVCKDAYGARYLILCIDEEEGKYICSQISNKYLLKLLNNEITMAEAFRHPVNEKDFLIEYDFENKEFKGYYIDISKLTPDMLPDEGAYFRLKNQKVTDYIKLIACEKEYQYQKATSCLTQRHIATSAKQYENIIFPLSKIKETQNSCNRTFIKAVNLNFGTIKSAKCYYVFMNSNNKLFNDTTTNIYNTERNSLEKCHAKI